MNKPYELNIRDGKPYWMVDILWVVLAEVNTTNGSYSLMWQLCPAGSGPPPHYHDQDEGFYVLDGQITYQAGEETLVATTGSFVWIPGGTVHSFKVDSPTATLLNSYTPAGFEQVIMHGGHPATHFELPKPGMDMSLSRPEIAKLFEKIGMHVL